MPFNKEKIILGQQRINVGLMEFMSWEETYVFFFKSLQYFIDFYFFKP